MRVGQLAIFAASPAIWLAPAPAIAQVAGEAESTAELRDEIARLRAEVEAMRAEMRGLRDQIANSPAPVAGASPPPAESTADAVRIDWKGAPAFSTDSGWSFKPRGRMQIDAGYLDAAASVSGGQADGRGLTTRVRRAYLGVQGTIPGGFAYRAEADFSGNSVSWTDLYLSYESGPFTFTIGQHHPFTPMEQLQSDLFLTFNERASFTSAFNLERRVGASMGYQHGEIMLNAGLFTDDVGGLTDDGNRAISYDGRIVWMPKRGDTQWHFGASAHYRDPGAFLAGQGIRYRARPYIATTDIRYVDTGALTVDSETQWGVEFAFSRRRVHVAAEAAWLRVARRGEADPTFFGGYVEAGLFLTDDTRSYRDGAFDRIIPTSPLGDGGFGALELSIRYDRLDLTDAGVAGGTQDGFGAALVWAPISYVRFLLNYMRLNYDIPGAQPPFNADVVGMRAQVDF